MIVIPANTRDLAPPSNAERMRLWRWKYDALPLEQQIGADEDNESAKAE